MRDILLFDKEQYIKIITGIDLNDYKFNDDVYKETYKIICDILNTYKIKTETFINNLRVELTNATHCNWDFERTQEKLNDKNFLNSIIMKSDSNTSFVFSESIHGDYKPKCIINEDLYETVTFDVINSEFDNSVKFVINKVLCDLLIKRRHDIVIEFKDKMNDYIKKIVIEKNSSEDSLNRANKIRKELETEDSFKVQDYHQKDLSNSTTKKVNYMGKDIYVNDDEINNKIFNLIVNPGMIISNISNEIEEFNSIKDLVKLGFDYKEDNNYGWIVPCKATFSKFAFDLEDGDETNVISANAIVDAPKEIVDLVKAYDKYIGELGISFDEDGIIKTSSYNRKDYTPSRGYSKPKNNYDVSGKEPYYGPEWICKYPSYTLNLDIDTNLLKEKIIEIKELIKKVRDIDLTTPNAKDGKFPQFKESLIKSLETNYFNRDDGSKIEYEEDAEIEVESEESDWLKDGVLYYCKMIERRIECLEKVLDEYEPYTKFIYENAYIVDKIVELWKMYAKRIEFNFRYGMVMHVINKRMSAINTANIAIKNIGKNLNKLNTNIMYKDSEEAKLLNNNTLIFH